MSWRIGVRRQRKFKADDLNMVARAEQLLLNRTTVNQRAIAAAQIVNLPAARGILRKLRMMARDGGALQQHLGIDGAADQRGCVRKRDTAIDAVCAADIQKSVARLPVSISHNIADRIKL